MYYILAAEHRKNGERVEIKEMAGVNKSGKAIPRIKYDTRGMELYFNLYPWDLDSVIAVAKFPHEDLHFIFIIEFKFRFRPNNFLPAHSSKKMTLARINHSSRGNAIRRL